MRTSHKVPSICLVELAVFQLVRPHFVLSVFFLFCATLRQPLFIQSECLARLTPSNNNNGGMGGRKTFRKMQHRNEGEFSADVTAKEIFNLSMMMTLETESLTCRLCFHLFCLKLNGSACGSHPGESIQVS